MIVNTKALKTALVSAGHFVMGRTPQEMLTRVCLRGTDTALQVEATGREGTIHIQIPTETPDTGLLAWVESETFAKSVKLATGDSVSLNPSEGGVTFAHGKAETFFPSAGTEKEWPGGKITLQHQTGEMTISADDLCEGVGRVAFASPRYSNDFAIAIYLTMEEGKLHFHAGDGRMVAFYNCNAVGSEFAVAIPTDPLKKACACLSGAGHIHIASGSNGILLRGETTQILLPLVSSGKVVTSHYRKKTAEAMAAVAPWEICRDDLVEFVAQAEVLTTVDSTGVTLEPQGDHVLAKYEGTSNQGGGSVGFRGSCTMEIEGTADGVGGRCDVKFLKPVVAHSTDDDFKFISQPKAFCVQSEGYMAFVAKQLVK